MHAEHSSPHSRQGSLASNTPLSPDIQTPRNRTVSLASIKLRAQTSISSASPVRRKPLPATASPVATRFSSALYSAKPNLAEGDHTERTYSIDGTPLRAAPLSEEIPSLPLAATQEEFVPENFDESVDPTSRESRAIADLRASSYSYGHAPAVSTPSPLDPLDDYIDGDHEPTRRESSVYGETLDVAPTRPKLERSASSYHTARYSIDEGHAESDTHRLRSHSRTPTMSSYGSNNPPPNLTLQMHGEDGVTGDFLDYEQLASPDDAAKEPPKSPGKFSSFFGWRASGQNLGADSPTTTFSEKSMSPGASPAMRNTPSGLNIPAANGDQQSYFTVPGTPLFSSSPSVNAHVEELEKELREISVELAGSIRREMELEDELERWQAEHPIGASDGNRRTSDYYSDSGASSARFPTGDSETKIEALEKLRRKAEQDKAQAKADAAARLQEELRRRTDLEAQVHALEEQLHDQDSDQVDTERVRELEAALEDARRRVADEKLAKENLEDLFNALRQEHDRDRQERDNLRDEVLPDLRARVDGLETEASRVQELEYESSRMQQEVDQLRSGAAQLRELMDENTRLRRELDTSRNDANVAEISQMQPILQENAKLQEEIRTLRTENQTLVNARRMELEMKQQGGRFNSIAEEEEISPIGTPKIGLSRSNSLARNSVQVLRRGSRAGSLSRSNSVKDLKQEGTRDVGERLKDLEEQRNALHQALKNLLARQEMQAKQHAKQVRLLEIERDRALNVSPRRTAFHREVSNLRQEIDVLRRRADNAIDSKWQAEKNLGGLHMDLVRAEQETSSLRELLKERDIFIQERRPSATSSAYEDDVSGPVVSLDKAYKELQTTHALSLARVKDLEAKDSLGEAGAETERVMELLKQSISDAESERDHAQHEAEAYRQQARELQESEIGHLAEEQSLAAQLFASATRMDELAAQVQQQLYANTTLKQRLAEAIERGEREQRASANRIMEMQSKLRAAEDLVMAAQNHSETMLAPHEDELRDLQEGQNAQLQRMKAGALLQVQTARASPVSPLSPMFTHRSPRIDKTTSGLGISINEATKTEALELRVDELERALSDADREMEEVVGRMNMAQIEVAELQAERDEAMRQTRRLQAEIVAEREQVRLLMA